ncbi:MAG: C25 family peptidase propeptide domain-containing protein [Bacteroidales bacterium]
MKLKYSDNWEHKGFDLKSQKSNGVNIIYSIQSFTLSEEIDGEMMDVISLPGNLLQNDEGSPNLPGTGRYIAIPQGASANMQIVAFRTEKFTNVEMAPAPRIPWETEQGPLEYDKNLSIYQKDAFYPENPVTISMYYRYGGVDVVMLGITPFQYNPVTKELIVYRDIEVNIDFEGGNGHFGDDRLRSRWWDPLLSDMLLNSESLPKMDYNKSFQATDEAGCEYLIVVPNDPIFSQWADSIRKFRTQQGILTDIKTLDDIGGNNVSTLENYFNNALLTGILYLQSVLLIGDAAQMQPS